MENDMEKCREDMAKNEREKLFRRKARVIVFRWILQLRKYFSGIADIAKFA